MIGELLLALTLIVSLAALWVTVQVLRDARRDLKALDLAGLENGRRVAAEGTVYEVRLKVVKIVLLMFAAGFALLAVMDVEPDDLWTVGALGSFLAAQVTIAYSAWAEKKRRDHLMELMRGSQHG